MHRCEKTMSIYDLNEPNAINNVTSSTNIHTFHIISICPWTNMPMKSHIYPTALLLWFKYGTHITGHTSAKKKKQFAIAPSYIIGKYGHNQICLSNTRYMPHMQVSSFADMRQLCQYIYLIWASVKSTVWPGALLYIYFTLLAYAPQHIWLLHCTYISHCTSVVYIYTPHSFTDSSKGNTSQHLFTKLLQNMCQEQKCPLNTINMVYAQITQCTFMGEVCQHICHTWSCCH